MKCVLSRPVKALFMSSETASLHAPTTVETAQKLGLLPEEYEKIKEILGRTPNFTELCAYSGMWSEHCSYKNSIVWLKTLPKKGKRMLAEAGKENAGLIDIGDGLGCAFKIESHNHPSAIEPYQGAATGVGGINRDIFTMGARPIAQLNSLRFGDIKNPKTKRIITGVVKGIGDYGNAFGVPTVGGEVFFDDCFTQNPLVNAMSVGILKTDRIVSAISYGVGNPVFIVGSATGKDGIHGASFASEDITEESAKNLPSVQVGDPFQEKLLLEASLELIETDAVVGMQDMGAAGIICSTAEMSAKGDHGMVIWLDKVPTRQADMQPFELLLSESQERMLVVVKKGQEDVVRRVFEKWDLQCVQIGEVTEGGQLEFFFHGEKVADLPARSLTLGDGAPVYHREYTEPAYIAENKKFDPSKVAQPASYKEVTEFLIGSLNIASKRWVYNQYDSMVGTVNMSTNAPTDAPVVAIKGSRKALVMTVDCNSRYVQADPETGCAIAVAEAARNIAVSGGEGLGVTNCLNFGNPYNPEVYWQFVHAIKGMSKACLEFETPVTGGNVSFYNQSTFAERTVPVFPTPTIGMVGLMDDVSMQMTIPFKNEGDLVYVIGKMTDDIASSEYLYSYLGIKNSPAPYLNLKEEHHLHRSVRSLIAAKLIKSAHDISDGGLIVCLLEKAFTSGFGFNVNTDSAFRKDAFLFGEGQGRAVITVAPEHKEAFEAAVKGMNLPALFLGPVAGKEAVVDGESFGHIDSLKYRYDHALEEALES
jgi:phosphoribosylformylglycinamidine synthase